MAQGSIGGRRLTVTIIPLQLNVLVSHWLIVGNVKYPSFKRYLLVLLASAAVVPELNADVLPGVSALSDAIVRESAIAFVNATASPGLEGATLTVDGGAQESGRSSLGFAPIRWLSLFFQEKQLHVNWYLLFRVA